MAKREIEVDSGKWTRLRQAVERYQKALAAMGDPPTREQAREESIAQAQLARSARDVVKDADDPDTYHQVGGGAS